MAAIDRPAAGHSTGDGAGAGITTDGTARWERLLGLLLAVLLLGHLIPLFVLGRGASGLDWNVMAARWAALPWRIWDLLLVWVAAGYAALIGGRWTRAREGRLAVGICCAALILAVLAAGTFAILTVDLDLG